MNLQQLGEFGLIRRLSTQLSGRGGVRISIGDDAALLEALRAPLVTCDCLVEEIHFRRDWIAPRALGFKAISVNVSDIAAMGGKPVAAFVTLALSEHDDLAWIEELYAGMEEAAALFDLTICGGDTARSPRATILNITLVGEAAVANGKANVIARSGAQAGDVLLVTGALGDSAAGLALLQNPQSTLPVAESEYLITRHHRPSARLREVRAVLQSPEIHYSITAGLDLSDGIAGDAAHIARASNVTLEIESALLPISAACKAASQSLQRDAVHLALTGGEDYELLWCARPDAVQQIIDTVYSATGTPVSIVGRCVAREDEAVKIRNPDGTMAIGVQSFEHF